MSITCKHKLSRAFYRPTYAVPPTTTLCPRSTYDLWRAGSSPTIFQPVEKLIPLTTTSQSGPDQPPLYFTNRPDSPTTFPCTCKRNFLCLQMISFEFLREDSIGWIVSRGKHFVHKDVLQSLYEFNVLLPKTENLSILKLPIWYNESIKINRKTVFYKNWYLSGITIVQDLFTNTGDFMSLYDFEQKYNFRPHFTLLQGLKLAILSTWPQLRNNSDIVPRPTRASFIELICKNDKGSRDLILTFCKMYIFQKAREEARLLLFELKVKLYQYYLTEKKVYYSKNKQESFTKPVAKIQTSIW